MKSRPVEVFYMYMSLILHLSVSLRCEVAFTCDASFFLSPSLIGQQKNVSCVASGGCGGYGRGQRSCQSVLGTSELSGAQL